MPAPPIPRRKPDFNSVQVMQAIERLFASPAGAQSRQQNPLAAVGAEGARFFPLPGREIRNPGGVVAGRFNPEGLSRTVAGEARRTGFSDIRGFDRDLITLSDRGIPREVGDEGFNTTLHELRHRGLEELRRSGLDVDGLLKQLRAETRLPLFEEDVVRIIGVFNRTEDREETRRFFKKRGLDLDELLKRPEVLEAAIELQRAGVGLVEERLAKPEKRSAINFPPASGKLRRNR